MVLALLPVACDDSGEPQPLSRPLLTQEEQAWLAAHPDIKVAPDPAFRPVEYFDEQGLYMGIAADYIRLVEQKLGITFNIVQLANWSDVLTQAQARKVDMWGAASPTPQRLKYMHFSQPLINVPAVIIVRKQVTRDLTINDLTGMRIAVIKGYAAHDYLLDSYPNLQLDPTPDIDTALKKVSFGLVDAMIGNLATSTYYMEQLGITNLRVAGKSGFQYRLAFATRSDWPELKSILDKTIASLTELERRQIDSKWISMGGRDPGLSREMLITMAIAMAFILFFSVLIWNLSLNRQVRQKTKALKNELEERARDAEAIKLAASVFSHTAEAIVITDPESRILRVNSAFVDATGYSDVEVLGKTPRVIHSGRYDEDFYREMWAHLLREGIWQGEIWNRRKDGDLFPVWETINAVHNEAGEITQYIGSFYDITERKLSEQHIAHLAHYDHLTDLPNRRLFDERCTHSIDIAKREGQSLAILFFDIDRFKQINDTMGHPVGDQVLQEVAVRLRSSLRGADTVSRLGGDEFAVLLEQIDSSKDASRVALGLLKEFDRPLTIDHQEMRISISIGISIYPDDGSDATTLIKGADVAMYRAKKDGGSSYQFYTEELTSEISDRLALELGLRRALERDELVLHYQPVIDLVTGQPVSAEALVRWNHPEQGLVSPDKFIHLAEETGLIRPLGEWVLFEACRQLKSWHDAGMRKMTISVNLSGRQFLSGGAIDYIHDILLETGLEPRYLILELTESTVMEHIDEIRSQLEQIRGFGVRLSVDDFGTGHSTLAKLTKLPFSILKIDRSFVMNVTSHPEEAVILRTIIAMAHTLRMEVVAEGVESEGQAGYLLRNECDLMQGYLFSRPLAADQFSTLMEETPGLDMTRLISEGDTPVVLVVDAEADALELISVLLEHENYQLLLADSPKAALEQMATQHVDVVVSDQYMPEMDGVEFLRRVRKIYPKTRRILLTAYPDMRTVVKAINEGAIYKFLTKPNETTQLLQVIREALKKKPIGEH